MNDIPSIVYSGWLFFVRDFHLKYRRTYLGILWAATPLLVLSIMSFMLLSSVGIDSPGGVRDFFSIVSSFIILFVFLDNLGGVMYFVRRNKQLIKYNKLHYEALVIAAIINSLVNLLIYSVVLIGAYYYIDPVVNLADFVRVLFLTIFLVVFFGCVVGILLAPLSIVYYDIRYAMPFLRYSLILTSPIFSAHMKSEFLITISDLNPLNGFLTPMQNLIQGIPYELDVALYIGIASIVSMPIVFRYFDASIRRAISTF